MEIKDEYRTLAVIQLATAIRQSKDYSLLPVLADAVEEAGGDGSELRGELNAIQASRLVCLVLGGEAEAAVKWMEGFALTLFPDGYDSQGKQPDYEWIIQCGTNWIECEDGYGHTTEYGSQSWGWELDREAKSFWKCFTIITGLEAKDENDNFFSCSC